MQKTINAELKQVETDIIRLEAQMFEIREQLTMLMGKRSALLTLSEKTESQ